MDRRIFVVCFVSLFAIGCNDGQRQSPIGGAYVRLPGSSSGQEPSYRWTDRTRARSQVEPVVISVSDFHDWASTANAASRSDYEARVHTITGNLRRVSLNSDKELELHVSVDENSSTPLLVATIPPTEPRVQERLVSVLQLEPGWAVEWADKSAPSVRVTGLPFQNSSTKGGARSQWELRPSWGIVLMKPKVE